MELMVSEVEPEGSDLVWLCFYVHSGSSLCSLLCSCTLSVDLSVIVFFIKITWFKLQSFPGSALWNSADQSTSVRTETGLLSNKYAISPR